jgi:hypothetical protein
MQSLHKRRRGLLVILCAALAVPLIFFGLPTFWDAQSRPGESVIATVGGVEIKENEFRANLDAVASQRRGPDGERLTYHQLNESGEAQEVLQRMIESALLTAEAEDRGFTVDRAFLEEQMREWDMFKDQAGNFDAKAWNAWVEDSGRRDWNTLFDEMEKQTARFTYLRQVVAPAARVLDADLDEQVSENLTNLTVRYSEIVPPIEATDEALRAFYDKAPQDFQEPDNLVAEFVALSLLPEPTEEILDLVRQAREGADFVALVQANADMGQENGGDLGWQKPMDPEFEHRKPMFSTPVGGVSDPVALATGFYIYKVEEERTDEATGQREVRVRQLFKRAALTEEEKQARTVQAEGILAQAQATGDLAGIATAEGILLQRSETFNSESKQIAGVSRADVAEFTRTLAEPVEGEQQVALVTGRENLYVAKVVERVEGRIPAYDEIPEKVRAAYEAAERSTQAYLDRVQDYAARIKAEATSLEDARTRFPELNLEVKDTQPFNRRAFFVSGPNLQAVEVFNAFKGLEVGALAGPLKSFFGDGKQFILELANRSLPEDAGPEKLAEERKNLRDIQLRTMENDLLEDYLADLRERKLQSVPLSIDQAAVDRILSIGREADETETSTS